MRALRSLDEIVIWVLIVSVAVINLAVYSGVVRGEDAINVQEQATEVSDDVAAETDDSANLPGTFFQTQGRQHVEAGTTVPFCEGRIEPTRYASNPPSSGLHVPVQRDVDLGNGNVINIPPDPGIYAFEIPRESIPHLQEHAGVYVGYHCVSAACEEAVDELERLVDELLDDGERVVMAASTDLAEDTFGLASWTRMDVFGAAAFDTDRVAEFVEAHSCRFDPEGFCDVEVDPSERA